MYISYAFPCIAYVLHDFLLSAVFPIFIRSSCKILYIIYIYLYLYLLKNFISLYLFKYNIFLSKLKILSNQYYFLICLRIFMYTFWNMPIVIFFIRDNYFFSFQITCGKKLNLMIKQMRI